MHNGYDSDVSDNNDSTKEEENVCNIAFSSDDSDNSVTVFQVNKDKRDKKAVVNTKSEESKNRKTPTCKRRKCTEQRKQVKKIGVKTRSMVKDITDIKVFSSDDSENDSSIACRTRLQRKKREYLRYFALTSRKNFKVKSVKND
jgi:hypothetical protein